MIFIGNKCLATAVLILNLDLYGARRASEVSALIGLPLRADVSVYLNSIERLMQFCDSHKTDIDMNLYFGLFLLNVNLRHVLIKKSADIPRVLNVTLNRIGRANGGLITFFQYMVTNTKILKGITNKNISFLFSNVDSWAKRIKTYDLLLNKKMKWKSKKELRIQYSSWEVYKKRINSYSSFRPGPEQSDKCLLSLAENPSKHPDPPYKCSLLEECCNAIENGTTYGYAITHRLLILLAARYSRGCYIYSPRVDEEVVRKLCTSMFEEAQYIATQGYKHPDLLMEQIGFCSLAGYKEFLQRSWLASMLKRQRAFGCFGLEVAPSYDYVVEDAPRPWMLAKEGTQIIREQCSGHLSAVAAGVLGAAVRFIIEAYY